jgi:hypothetical protein
MRLSDAGLRRRNMKLIYLNHLSLLGSSKTRPAIARTVGQASKPTTVDPRARAQALNVV